MSVPPGTRLGPYEIVAPLGAGGMGEVYRARDTRLDRDVAIKVLPALFARDPDRITRLEQEARAAAALNAPGILAVFDIGSATVPGASEPLTYVVMELLDGESLRTRIEHGPLPPRKAAEYASQIAAALDVAHARGIVHRDLKPENLFLTRSGQIKILDFGLAKAVAPIGVASVATGIADTAAGTVLGTVGYMAPEQVRGEPADARSDIFALGATLYEMLTGRRAFSKNSAVETMNAILNEDPPELPPETTAAIPGPLQAILARCLEKRREDRFHSAHDLALALQAASMGRATTSTIDSAPPPRRSVVLPLTVGAAVVIAGVAAAAMLAARRAAPEPVVTSLKQLTELPGPETNADISPDGRQVLYTAGSSGNFDIYLLRVGGGRAIDLTANSSVADSQGAFSPDGEQIAFRSDRDGGGIFVMGATGESVRRLTTGGFDPRWSPDGTRIVYSTEGVDDPYSRSTRAELWVADASSGQTSRLWTGDAVEPVWSPNGKRIAFWSNTGGQRDIATIAAAGGTPVSVTNDASTEWAPEWSPDGRWLYFISDRGGSPNLWRIAIDPDAGAVSGGAELMTNGVRPISRARFSHDGSRMVVEAYDRSFEIRLYDFNPATERVVERSTIHSPSLGWCGPSHDAAWLACTSRTGQEDIVLMRADGRETRRLTDDAFKDRIPVWSPDDKHVVFMSTRSGQWELWQVGADGAGLRQLTSSNGDVVWGVYSPDGKRLGTSASSVRPFGLKFFDAQGVKENSGAESIPVDERFTAGAWSSDGRLLAGDVVDDSGHPLALAIWDVSSRRISRKISVPLQRASSIFCAFIPGTHRLLAQSLEGVLLVDADSGASRPILETEPSSTMRLSGDGRTLMIERQILESDLWLMQFRQ